MTSSTSSPRIHGRRAASAVAAALLAAVVVLFAPATAASAHDELVGSDPAADSVLTEAPGQITLTFSAELLTGEGATDVQVQDAAGAAVQDGAPVVDGAVVTQALPAGLAGGAYTVLWKVVSSDGHPISGQLAFTVDAPVTSPTATPSQTATEEPSEAATTPPATVAPVEPDADTDTASALPWVIGGIVGVAILGALVYLLVARARRQRDAEKLRADQAAGASPTESADPTDR